MVSGTVLAESPRKIRVLQLYRTFFPDVKIEHMGGFVGRKTIKHHVFFALSALKFSMRHGWKLW
jgi:hypothetical protein